MPAMAVTDHGVMFGALDFYEAGRAAGIKPILGVEAYVAPRSRFDRNPGENEEKYHHLTILARNETGYRNLLKLVTDAHLEGFYHRPRIDKELLAEHAEGLIGAVGMPGERAVDAARSPGRSGRRAGGGGTLPRHLRPRSFFVELQDHGIPDQRRVLPEARRARPVASTSRSSRRTTCTTPMRSDAKPHDVLLCIQQQKVQTRPEAAEVRLRGVLPEVRAGDATRLPRTPRGVRQHAADRGVASSSTSCTAIAPRRISGSTCRSSSRRIARASRSTCASSWTGARPSDTATLTDEIRDGSTTSWTSSARWGSRATS